ncbi:hypothetical protein RclHR1_02920010 [Rhizophagus clarus]|uniref:Kinase-like domain-containing protein n=1 Tax=Rhizophagus clarus TaxID=94130 RepID=A0A2Z6R4X6_9GLOM|nr:hypothetical protein RclHR1_02920010 [Rhizophagus clarus]GES76098.1 kinase-like domain-containing protein [Rhizophagus clarus]
MVKGKKIQVFLETEFNISDKNSSSENINHEYCSYCYKSFNTKELWCKECDPFKMIEGWTSGNDELDKLIKDTIYDARYNGNRLVEWVPFDRFENIVQIGEGGFAKVYSAMWIDGKAEYYKQDDGNWKKRALKPIKVALKRLNGSQNMSAEYLNELKIHLKFCQSTIISLKFYGITKDPETKDFMIILQFADEGNLRNILSKKFNNLLWKDKIRYLHRMISNLRVLHYLGYFHKDLHSGNVLQRDGRSYISDFGLSGLTNKQKSDDKIYGVLPYVAPEVLNREPYTLSSDIYSFGVIMTESSSGKPPFYNRKHDVSLVLDICDELRPEFGKGTPEIYKELAYKCMNANSSQRPTADELYKLIVFWMYSTEGKESYQESEKFGYKGKEIKIMFEEADKEIPNISTSYKKDHDAIYINRIFTFNNLIKPVNIIALYLDDEENSIDNQDSQLVYLNVSSSLLQSKVDDTN